MKIWKLGLIGSVVTAALAAGTGTVFSQENRLIRGGEPMLGPAQAPVTVVMFCDFQCPHCAEARPIVDTLASAYPSEMRLVYRNYPVLRVHADAGRAAEAAYCAQEQGRFWDMYRSMLANQGELDASGLIRQAGDIGLDSRLFSRCLESGRHRADWRRDQTDAAALGVSGTPTFFVNGTRIEGASLPVLDGAIRGLLGR
jgi:protein-disulfide isomerase